MCRGVTTVSLLLAALSTEPGYSLDLCTLVAAGIGKQLAMTDLTEKFVRVTVESRIQAVVRGAIDLECGTTTASLSRTSRWTSA